MKANHLIIKCAALMALGFLSLSTTAQNLSGKATYQTSRKIDIQLDSSRMGAERYEAMMAMLRKQFEKTFILTFTGDESVYEEKPKLKSDGPQHHGMEIVMIGDGGGDILYRDLAKGIFKRQTDMMGKIFLIEDSIPKADWVKHKESKQIGNYTCFKATRSYKEERRMISIENGKEVEKVDSVQINIEAWYTPQIGVSQGPSMYSGLPGLIMEIHQNGATMLCTEVVLRTSGDIEIEAPDQGKKVNQESFDQIMDKKLKAARKQRGRPKKGDGDSHKFEIRIGG